MPRSTRPTPRLGRRAVVGALTLALALNTLPAGGTPSRQASLTVGSVLMHRCTDVVPAWCAKVREPLDPFMQDGPTISVGFVWYPATGTPVGTLVADEGGPGWPATGSAPEYRSMYGPLLASRNLLLVDNRGTGRSSAIDCPGLQNYVGSTVGSTFQGLVGACGRKLNHTWRGPDGRFIHASDLFATTFAVRDMADIIRRLGVGPVDLYGDSYGTWFVQSFLSRFPSLLRSVILDSAYPMFGGSAWYPSSARTARKALRLVCERDVACRRAAPTGSPRQRIGALARRLRVHPISGMTTNPNGRHVMEHVYVRSIVNMMQNAGFDPIGYRQLDAAVRAALVGDNAPILRLSALSDFYDDATPTAPHVYSDGLYFAVSCSEYSQLFNMDSSIPARRRQLAAAERTQPAATRWFTPFTAAEWAQTNAYSEAYTSCLSWPSWQPSFHVHAEGHQAPLAPPDLPVLVTNGDLDSWTSASFGPELLKQLGPSARFIETANSVHTAALGDTTSTASTACADSTVRAFIEAPQDLFSLQATCAAHIPPVHTVGSFPTTLGSAPAARVLQGSAGVGERRAATVAAEAFGDAMMSFYVDNGSKGAGLRGGTFVGHGWPAVRLRVNDIRWVADATVSGRGIWHTGSGKVKAMLTVHGPGGSGSRFAIWWSENRPFATARLLGTHRAVLRFPAP